MGEEVVVLLDDDGHAVGTAPKASVHTGSTPLHLAFSCYVVTRAGVLLTRRAPDKATFPGVWTNSLCGHPAPGEPLVESARRRARDELGLELGEVRLVLPRFRYRAEMLGVVEHEWCPVLVATPRHDTPDLGLVLDPAEVADHAFVPWTELVAQGDDPRLSPWCREQLPLLAALGPDPAAWPAGDPALLPPAVPRP